MSKINTAANINFNFAAVLVPIDKCKTGTTQPGVRGLKRKELNKIKNSIQKYGLMAPLQGKWSKSKKVMYITDGNGRLQALRELGWQEIPVLPRKDACTVPEDVVFNETNSGRNIKTYEHIERRLDFGEDIVIPTHADNAYRKVFKIYNNPAISRQLLRKTVNAHLSANTVLRRLEDIIAFLKPIVLERSKVLSWLMEDPERINTARYYYEYPCGLSTQVCRTKLVWHIRRNTTPKMP